MTSIVTVETTKNTQYTTAIAAADDAARLTALATMLSNSSTESSDNTDNFYGEIRFLEIAGAIRIAQVYVGRYVPESEQTDVNFDVIRMETGKALVASYYGVDGYNITFTTELQLAVSSLVGAAGVAIATCASGLLVF